MWKDFDIFEFNKKKLKSYQSVKMVEAGNKKDKYERISKLGVGAFGKAYHVRSKITSKEYVIKMIELKDMTREEKETVRNESTILMALNHPNITKFERCYKDKQNNWNIVMEYADNGTLDEVITAR